MPREVAALTRLGPYEITGALGQGGMGIVYRARDPRLDREVAIKVLPDAVAADAERVARFQREARVLATLNHPNVGAIYGVETEGARLALVLELVEGETLDARIRRAPLPVDEALKVARQIVQALDAAHEAGIVHRDLKPANVKLRPDGTVKVLDFGLARTGGPTTDESPTMTGATRDGMVVGTAAYMSPEQARGQHVDKRTDIWAFGCVLFELLSGRRAFEQPTISDTLAAVLTGEPAWSRLPPGVSPPLNRLLRHCLQKNPAERLRDIGDAVYGLEPAAGITTPGTDLTAAGSRATRTASFVLVATVAAIAGAAAMWVGTPRRPDAPPQLARAAIPVAGPEGLFNGGLALTSDGTHVAYMVGEPPTTTVIVQRLADGARVLQFNNARDPFFSPDGQWLGFFADSKLKKASLGGGTPVALTDAGTPRGASWTTDGHIVFAPLSRDGLYRIRDDGGEPIPLSKPDVARGETSHRYPHVLPDGKTVLFMAEAASRDNSIVALSLETGQRHDVLSSGWFPAYSPTKHLVYTDRGVLTIAPFDVDTLQTTGPPHAMQRGVARFAFSSNGHLVHTSASDSRPGHVMVWVDRQAREEALNAPPQFYSAPSLSPDAKRIAVAVEAGPDRNVWVYEPQTDALTRVTLDGANMWPVWAAASPTIFYASNRPGTSWDLYRKAADGSGADEALLTKEFTQIPRSVSADGELMAFTQSTPTTGQDIWLWRRQGDVEPFLRTPVHEDTPALSADGRWVAYVSNESGRNEVYVRPVRGDSKWRISTNGGTEPLWNPRGNELLYRNGEQMISVAITMTSGIGMGRTQVLFEGRFVLGPNGERNYDITRDGQRFIMIRRIDDASTARQLSLIVNWFAELQSRNLVTR